MAVYKTGGHAHPSEHQPAISTLWNNLASGELGFIRGTFVRHELQQDEETSTNKADSIDAGSYDAARRACVREVNSIARECSRKNEMFTDLDFDIWNDYKKPPAKNDCLFSLPSPADPNKKSDDGWGVQKDEPFEGRYPRSAHRIHEIFDEPLFAPQSPKRFIPSLEARLTIQPSPWSLLRWIHGTRCTSQVLCGIVASWYFMSRRASAIGTLLCLLSAGAFLICKLNKRPDGPRFASSHIKQSGYLGDCWLLSAIATLCGRNDLLRRICVAWDQDCGVYGFVFYRDGAWIHTVVDDRLFLRCQDYHDSHEAKSASDLLSDRVKLYQSVYQKGASSLFFGTSGDSKFTWLPLLEKAYAKAHGDYEALNGGNPAAGIEDITGGVGDSFNTKNVQDRDRLWHGFRDMKKDHVYAVSSADNETADYEYGIAPNHAFAVEAACEFYSVGWGLKKVRLLKIRNPWGSKNGLWEGDWGIGSDKWHPISMWWLQSRGHEDGIFYMPFEDAMENFEVVYRLRLFDDLEWTCRQEWVGMKLTGTLQYHPTHFEISLKRNSEVTISVSQLDTQYFRTLQGRHFFHLEFLVKKQDAIDGDYIAKSRPQHCSDRAAARSVSVDTELEQGTYKVLVKITAVERDGEGNPVWDAEQVVKKSPRSHKLQQAVSNYNMAYDKLATTAASHLGSNKKEFSSQIDLSKKLGPRAVGRNALCGVGLRVFSKDSEMQLDVRESGEEMASELGRNLCEHRLCEDDIDVNDGWGGDDESDDGQRSVSSRHSTSRRNSDGFLGLFDGADEPFPSKRVDSVVEDANRQMDFLGDDGWGYVKREEDRQEEDISDVPTDIFRSSCDCVWTTATRVHDCITQEQVETATRIVQMDGPASPEENVNEAEAAEDFYQNGS